MTDNAKSPLTVVAEGLTEVKDHLHEILTEPEHSSILLYAKGALGAMINRFHFLAGTTPTASTTEQFPPVTNFMGEELTLPKPIKPENLSPDELERDLFVDKVNRLYATIQTIPVDGVLNSYTLPEDQLVIRGVAKRAGLEGYEDREINPAFISDICDAIKAKDARSVQETQIEAELANQTKLAGLQPQLQDAINIGNRLDEELVNANKEVDEANTETKLKKAHAKVREIKAQIEPNAKLRLKLMTEINNLNLKS